MGRRAALISGVVGLGVVTLAVTLPFLLKDRILPAVVVQPPGLFTTVPVPIPPGKAVCLRNANIDAYSRVAVFRVGTRQKAAVPLELSLKGKGHFEKVRIPGTYLDNSLLSNGLPPPKRATTVDACVKNLGDHAVDLYGTRDTTVAPVTADLEGERENNFALAFYESAETQLVRRGDTIAERSARFRPVGPLFVLGLAILVIAGVPLLLLGALYFSAEAREAA